MATPNQQPIQPDASRFQAIADGNPAAITTVPPASESDDISKFLAIANGTAQQPRQAQAAQPQVTPPSFLEKTGHFLHDLVLGTPEEQANSGVGKDMVGQRVFSPEGRKQALVPGLEQGAEKGLTETLSGTSQLAGKAANKLHLRKESTTGIFGEAPATPAETSPDSAAEHVGYLSENLMEFIGGDEALKGLSLAEKFGLATKIAKLAESHPAIARLIGLGLRASRTGVVSGVQAAAHGGDTGDVATAAVTGLATSAATEGLGELSSLERPGTKEIAGEEFKTAPKWKGANTAAKLAEENQAPAQRAISNVARESADKIVQQFGKQAPDTIASFHDAAQAVQDAAQPVFKKLDSISDGQFQVARNEMDRAAKVMRRATSMKDLSEAEDEFNKGQQKIDAIFQKADGQVSATDLQNAKSAWRSMKTLEKIHTKLDAAFTVPQSAAEISGVERTVQLQKLQGRLNAAFKAIPKADIENVLGAEGTRNLYELSALGADPAKAQSLTEVAREIGTHLGAGGLGAGAGALLGHALPGGAIAIGIHTLYLHPEVGSLVAKALSKGTNPRLVVPAVLQLLKARRTSQ